jgi:hypothetical protein
MVTGWLVGLFVCGMDTVLKYYLDYILLQRVSEHVCHTSVKHTFVVLEA